MRPRALFVLAVAASLGPGGLPGGSPLPSAAGQERAPVAPGGAPLAPSATGMALHERAGRECGLDSLFVLLRLTGHDVTYDQTRAAVPIGPMGSSLLELQQAASRLGAKTTLSRCSMAELMHRPKPVIAYLKRAAGPEAGVGHFVVVVSADETGVEIADSAVATFLKYNPSHFEEEWSGHILSPAPAQTWFRPLTLTAVGGVWLGVGLLWWRARVLRRVQPAPVPAALAQAEGA
jgi:hypothetical protein